MLTLRTAWIVAVILFVALAVTYWLASTGGREERERRLAILGSGLFLGLIAVRMPELFRFDRVWAETTSLYFLHAYENGPASALFRQVSNYFDLSANLASTLAVLAGLHLWPVVDIGFGFLPMVLLPFCLAGLGFSPRHRIGILLVVAGAIYTIHSGETFGSVLHVKGRGGIYAFLVLLSLALGHPLGWLHKALLLVLPLTGPPAALLLIIFAGAVIVLRRRASYRVLPWAAPGVAVQVASVLFGAGRGTGLDARPLELLAPIYGADLFVGKILGGLVFPKTVFNPVAPELPEVVLTNLTMAALLVAALVLYVRMPERRDTTLLFPVLVAQFMATVALAVGGARLVFETGGPRYFFPTLCMVGALAVTSRVAARRWFAPLAAAVVIAIVVNDRPMVRAYDNFVFLPHNPPWKTQIEQDTDKPIRTISTYPRTWTFDLPNCGEYYCGKR